MISLKSKKLRNFNKLTRKERLLIMWSACHLFAGKNKEAASFLTWHHVNRCAAFFKEFVLFLRSVHGEDDPYGICKIKCIDEISFFLGLYHDVGKLLIPSHIIAKPGELTKNEYEIVKTHVRREIAMKAIMEKMSIDPASMPRVLSKVIIGHHQLLDGSGYGYLDEDLGKIGSLVKVSMVIDAYEAATSRFRPYRKRKEPHVILRELLDDVKKGKIDRDVLYEFLMFLNRGFLNNMTCFPVIIEEFFYPDAK